MIYSYLKTSRIPKELSEGVVYHNPDFEMGALLCACGCGLRIDLLVPDSHRITHDKGLATIRPSILVCAGSCRSHYFITAGHVEWAEEFTPAEASELMRRQIARHVMRDKREQPWKTWSRALTSRFPKWIKSVFRR